MKSSTKLILPLLLAVLVGVGVLLVGDGNPPEEFSPARQTGIDAQPLEPEEAPEIEPIDEQPETSEESPLEGLRTLVLAEAEPGEDELPDLVVQVWSGRLGVPAPQAEVYVVDGFEGPELNDPFAQHWSVLAEEHGDRFQADAEGRVELPSVEDWAIVTARLPGAYGFAKVGRKHRDVVAVTLQPDETVTIRVVDGEDRPVAGAMVGVVQKVPVRDDPKRWAQQARKMRQSIGEVEQWMRDNPTERRRAEQKLEALQAEQARLNAALRKARGGGRDRSGGLDRQSAAPSITPRDELRGRRLTDDTGIAVFRHFQAYRRGHEEWWPEGHRSRFEAGLMVPTHSPESRPFFGQPAPTEVIELRMPPTGSIALRSVDLDGRPFRHPVHAELRAQGEGMPPWTRVGVRKEQGEEWIEFPYIGLGLSFSARCRLDDDDFRWQVEPLAGPAGPGERVEIDLVVAPDEGMLFGRVLDDAGVALGDVAPTFLINSSAGRLEGEEVTLDANGRFHLPYQVRAQHRGPFEFEIRRRDVHPTVGVAMMLAELPEARITDLGDLRIGALDRIAHGTVVDDEGRPLAAARVGLQREREVGRKQIELRFVNEAFVETETDEQGRYTLFGQLEPGRYRLRAEYQDHFPLETDDLGSVGQGEGEQIDLALLRKSRIVGSVFKPAWMPSDSLRVRLLSADDPEFRREEGIADSEGKQYIYFDWVRAGLYNIEIRTRDFPDPFLRIDGIVLEPGQVGVHPLLTDLDLGAYLFRFEVAAVNENGESIHPRRPLIARVVRPGGQVVHVGFPWDKSRAEIFSIQPLLDVWPLAIGHVAEPTTLGQGSSELRFLSIPPVRLTLPGLRRQVGDAPVWITLTLTGDIGLPAKLERWDRRSGRIAGWFGRSRSSGAGLGEGDVVRVEVMRDGPFDVIAHLGKRDKDTSRPVRAPLGAIEVRLDPGEGPQRITLNYDIDAVDAALIELAAQQAGN